MLKLKVFIINLSSKLLKSAAPGCSIVKYVAEVFDRKSINSLR